MKKILYIITQSEMGGAQRYVFDLARSLKASHEVAVAFGEQGEAGELAQLLRQADIPFFVVRNLQRNISPINDYLALGELTKIIDDFAPDVVHLNSTKISILGSLAARQAKIRPKVVYTAHGWVFKEPMSCLKKKLYLNLEKYTAKYKDKIICISKLDLELAKSELDIKQEKLTLIYNGLDNANYDFLPRTEAYQKLTKEILNEELPEGALIVGTIANLYATKDLQTFILAITELQKLATRQVVGVIIGEGPQRGMLAEFIKANKANVYLAGRVMEAANYLEAFDYYVCSSVKEGLPYTILESMAAGVPIISTKVGGVPDIIKDGTNGLLVEVGDYQAIANKIADLESQPENKAKTIKLAKDIQQQALSLEAMTRDTLDVYNLY